MSEQAEKPFRERYAYKRAIVHTCNVDGCKKLASYEVMGPHGTYIGDYCEEHANNKLALLGVPEDQR